MPAITEFRGEYRFLSNFYPSEIDYDGYTWPTVEHAFQAAKAKKDSPLFHKIRLAETPGAAKGWGRQAELPLNWYDIRINIMSELLRLKFANPVLAAKLERTGDAELIEGNTWGDMFWGVCKGVGENWLGYLLMVVREEVKAGCLN